MWLLNEQSHVTLLLSKPVTLTQFPNPLHGSTLKIPICFVKLAGYTFECFNFLGRQHRLRRGASAAAIAAAEVQEEEKKQEEADAGVGAH